MQNVVRSLELASPSDSQHILGLLKQSRLTLQNQKMLGEGEKDALLEKHWSEYTP